MKLFTMSLLGAALLLAGGCAQRVLVQPSLDVNRYNRLAVMPFETDSIFSTLGNQLADEMILEFLKKAPALDVVERTRIDMLLREQGLVQQGAVDPQSAVSVGRMLGVNAIVTGSLSASIGLIEPSPGNSMRVTTGMAVMRVIDTETGKIIWSGREDSQYSAFVSNNGQGNLAAKTDQEMLMIVVQELAHNLAQAFYPHYELRY